MPLFDLPLAELRTYRTAAVEPPGLDEFWARALAHAREAATEVEVEPFGGQAYGRLAAFDVTFSGADGDRVKAWYLRPEEAGEAELPCRLTFVGYGGGRDLPAAHTLYPACGYATFVMDTRSQGGTWSRGDTADPGAGVSGPEHPGVMTRGIASPETYYYRRLYVDAVRAVETAAELPGVDRARIGVGGASQGGALALAAAALCPELVRLCHADVPFLCDIERGMDVAFDPPYTELVTYLAMHPELDERCPPDPPSRRQRPAGEPHRGADADLCGASRHHRAAVDRLRGLQRRPGAEGDSGLPVRRSLTGADKPCRTAAARFRHRVRGKAVKLAAALTACRVAAARCRRRPGWEPRTAPHRRVRRTRRR